jgi:hypothetical protein
MGLMAYCLPASLMELSAMRSVVVVFFAKTSLYLPPPHRMALVGDGVWSTIIEKAFSEDSLIVTTIEQALSVLWPLQSNTFPNGSCELRNLEEYSKWENSSFRSQRVHFQYQLSGLFCFHFVEDCFVVCYLIAQQV